MKTVDCENLNLQRRLQTIHILQHKYESALVVLTLHIPGAVKNSDDIERIFLSGQYEIEKKLLRKQVPLLGKITTCSPTGDAYFCAVDCDPLTLKAWMHPLEKLPYIGRMLNIDVYASNGDKITREMLGLPPRQCYLCHNPAKVCQAAQRHSVEDLRTAVLERMERYFALQETYDNDHCL